MHLDDSDDVSSDTGSEITFVSDVTDAQEESELNQWSGRDFEDGDAVSHDPSLSSLGKEKVVDLGLSSPSHSLKALNTRKIKQRLGLSEDELASALRSSSSASSLLTSSSSLLTSSSSADPFSASCSSLLVSVDEAVQNGLKDKKKNKKALASLGFDPGHKKLMDSLGIDDDRKLAEALIESQVESVEFDRMLQDEKVERELVADKKRLIKPIQILGCDPSAVKLQRHLGITEEQFKKAQEDSEQILRETSSSSSLLSLSSSSSSSSSSSPVSPAPPRLSKKRTHKSTTDLGTKKYARQTTDIETLLMQRRMSSEMSALERQQLHDRPKLQRFFGLNTTEIKLSNVFGVELQAIHSALSSSSSSSSSSSLVIPEGELEEVLSLPLDVPVEVEVETEGESTDDTIEQPSIGTPPDSV
eukprot:TRINITY_DN905_c1_g1_i1.p1 TRINITY_DN905_c1_g1~~TRINITY_DN905_c1_g1_i1.p1  ORF type:complete len:457 (+),score=213.99 TRINITY_DN905_c1_g1_i1:125-1372(+)